MRVYTDEELELVKKLYLEGVTCADIGKAIHTDRMRISDLIKQFIESGELEKRKLRRGKRTEEQTVHMIVALYNDGVLYEDIAKRVGKSKGAVGWIIRKLIDKGAIEKRKKVHSNQVIKRRRVIKPRKFTRKTRTDYVINDKPIKCTCAVARTCIFGTCNEQHRCNFIGCTGKARILICPPDACTVYQKITKDNPRRILLEDICGYAGDKNG